MLFNKSIKHRLIVGFLAILIVVILGSVGITIYRGIDLTGKILGDQALTSAKHAVKLIDSNKLDMVIKSMKEDSADYQMLQEKLATYREGLGVEYLYTMTKNSKGQFIYLIDGMRKNDKGFSRLGEVEQDQSYYRKYQLAMDGEVVTNNITFGQKWGELVSAYIPIKNINGQVIAFLGIDIKAAPVLSMIRSNTITTIFTIILVLSLGTCAVFLFSMKLTKPLIQMRDYFSKSPHEAHMLPFKVKSRDEVSDIAKILNKNIDAVRTILNNTGEGLLTFGQNLYPNMEYSSECRRIFGTTNLDGTKFPELLYPDDNAACRMTSEILSKIFCEESEVRRKAYLSLLPQEVHLYNSYIQLEFKLIEKAAEEEFIIMVIMNDVTEKKLLEFKIDEEKKLLDMVVNVLVHINDITDLVTVYQTFCNIELWDLLRSNREDQEILYDILREIHTFKGDFGVYGLNAIVQKLHDVEEFIVEAQKQGEFLTRERLSEYFIEVNLVSFIDEDLQKVSNLVGDNIVDRIKGMEKSVIIDYSRLKRVEEDIIDRLGQAEGMKVAMEIRKLRFRQFSELLKSYPEYIERIGEKLQKLVYMNLEDGDDFLVDTEIYKDFTDSLVHIFRNAVDHGIEDPEERVAVGKDEYGCISCKIFRNNDRICIDISDDGRGIGLERVKAIAMEKGIITKNQAESISDQEITRLVFCKEMTTKEEVTVISGRGMGLSAFITELEKLNGNVKVETTPGAGTTFKIDIPDFEKIITYNLAV